MIVRGAERLPILTVTRILRREMCFSFKLARCYQDAKPVESRSHEDSPRVISVLTVWASSLKTKLIRGDP
ncbi:unnamed protein product [Urochloa humidicola]